MADFTKSLDHILKAEGGYSNHPNDRGGETKFGISKRSYPSLDIKALTIDDAHEIYRRDFWEPIQGGELDNQQVANKILSMAVNDGVRRAGKVLQRALRAVGDPVAIDGMIGPKTIAATNASHPVALLAALRSEMSAYYRTLVARDPSQAVFLDGWENRAYA